MLDGLRFTLSEIIAFIGIAQCLYILVYFSFRVKYLARAAIPAFYFIILALALMSDIAERFIATGFEPYFIIQSFLWFLGPPLSYLLIIQVAQVTRVPDVKHFNMLTILPLLFIAAFGLNQTDSFCESLQSCQMLNSYLTLAGLAAGLVSMLSIWLQRGFLDNVSHQSVMGTERYWLIISLIIVNVIFLGVMLLSLAPNISYDVIKMIRAILGLGFVYIASSSLFRIYPRAVNLSSDKQDNKELSDKDVDIALQIEKLLNLDKLYHETNFSRKDMAREIGISEAHLSKIINVHFGKSFPQLMNERRIEDAKRLLMQTNEPVKIIASEVGFNSLATFNRVFKDITDLSPTQYREN